MRNREFFLSGLIGDKNIRTEQMLGSQFNIIAVKCTSSAPVITYAKAYSYSNTDLKRVKNDNLDGNNWVVGRLPPWRNTSMLPPTAGRLSAVLCGLSAVISSVVVGVSLFQFSS
jgi:hypothetical protein